MGVYEQIQANLWKSRILLAILIAALSSITYLRFRSSINVCEGMLWVVLSAVIVAYFYRHTDNLVLSVAGATSASGYPYLHYINCVEGVSIAAGLPTPKPFVIADQAPSSFAVGRDPSHSTICVTTGLIDLLNRDELEAVVGHEIAHIASYDTKLMTLVTAIVWAVQSLSLSRAAQIAAEMVKNVWWRSIFILAFVVYSVGLYLSVGPDDALIGVLGALAVFLALWSLSLISCVTNYLQSSICRQRDFMADANGALLVRHPDALAQALSKLGKDHRMLRRGHSALVHLLIHNPALQSAGLQGKHLFTHPPIEERIMRLKQM